MAGEPVEKITQPAGQRDGLGAGKFLAGFLKKIEVYH